MSFNGYEYEDWLLTQWGEWNRFGWRNNDAKGNWGIIDVGVSCGGCEISDDVALSVNHALVPMEPHERRTLKRFYVNQDPDCDERIVAAAVKRFAGFYESPKRRIA